MCVKTSTSSSSLKNNNQVTLSPFADSIFTQFDIEQARIVVAVCSTTGDGDPPDNAARFFRQLKPKPDNPTPLTNLTYTILGWSAVSI